MQKKVLRYAFRAAESSFDPPQIVDLYSRTSRRTSSRACTATIRSRARPDPALHGDRAARGRERLPALHDPHPPRHPVRGRPGLRGKPRELVAQDYVYAIERFADPALRSPTWSTVEQAGILGLAELHQRALDTHQPFDYDAPVAGLRTLDRYTLRIDLEQPRPRLVELLANGDLYGAVAREVVERYGQDIGAHPVGTGPFRIAQWRRASLVALERNPDYRAVTYDAQPARDDAEGQAMLARLRGRRLPMIDRVEISIIEQDQPRCLFSSMARPTTSSACPRPSSTSCCRAASSPPTSPGAACARTGRCRRTWR